MAKFVIAYRGGMIDGSPEEQEAALASWIQWFGSLGPAVTEMGNPFGPSTSLQSDGSREAASANLTGYSVIEADTIDDAARLMKDCPIFSSGGSVEIYEAIMM